MSDLLVAEHNRTVRSFDWLFRNLNFPQTAQGVLDAACWNIERKKNKKTKNEMK